MWWVMFLMGCNPDEILKGGVSVPSAITVIELRYALFGIPSDLSHEAHTTLMQSVQSLYCTFSTNPPAGLGLLTRLTFLSTLRSMWADLGGLPEDLGC